MIHTRSHELLVAVASAVTAVLLLHFHCFTFPPLDLP